MTSTNGKLLKEALDYLAEHIEATETLASRHGTPLPACHQPAKDALERIKRNAMLPWNITREWGVWCEVEGGITGSRSAWLKGGPDGKQRWFTMAEAEAEAKRLTDLVSERAEAFALGGLRNVPTYRYTARRVN